MDIQEIQNYLNENKDNEDVKTFLDGFSNLDVFKNKLNTDSNFKSFLDSEKDKHSSKSLETWKANNLNKLIDEEVKKRFPEADPKDMKIKELEQKFELMQKEATKKELTNKALKQLQDKKLPTDLVDYFIGQDEETTNNNINRLVEIFGKHDEAIKTEFAKGNSYTPPNGGNIDAKKQLEDEVAKYFK